MANAIFDALLLIIKKSRRNDVVNKIEQTVLKYRMTEIYDGAILGFSGGADSSALLHFLKGRTKNLLCVHINHMIRGSEADRDEAHARKICENYGVKFLSFKLDIPKIAKETGKGLEEAARDARYEVFNRLLSENPEYKCIVTAHNSDDNLETVIFNLSRGTGVRGLIGIRAVHGNIRRPLIEVSKSEVLRYCEENQIPYVTDSTNSDTKYTRNRIRHKVIPELKELNPAVLESCLRLGEILRQDEEYFQARVDEIIKSGVSSEKIPQELFSTLDLPILTRLLVKLFGGALDYTAQKSIIELGKRAEVGSYICLHGDKAFKIERGYAHFTDLNQLKKLEYSYELAKSLTYLPEIDAYISLNEENVPNGYFAKYKISLNSEKIKTPLTARSRKSGDTVKHGGMTKKIKKLFVDSHIPSHLRDKIPLIINDGKVICIPGVIVGDGYSGKDYIVTVFEKGSKND